MIERRTRSGRRAPRHWRWSNLLIVLLVWPFLAAASPNDSEIAALYARGLAGDEKAVVSCITALEARLARQPSDQLARVYLGSAYTLRSRDLPFGLTKLRALRHGIALLDEAAVAAPENGKVQLLRAVTYEAFPALLGRARIARKALDDLVAAVEKNPRKLNPSDQQLLYLNAGDAAKKAGDEASARELWKRGAALTADPSLTKEIRAALSSG